MRCPFDNGLLILSRLARCSEWGRLVRVGHNGCRTCRTGSVCAHLEPSKDGMAYFVALPMDTYDRFYCGCQGWD